MPNKRTAPIPARLQEARHQVGLTQERVAEKAGLSRNSIARYESGTVGPSPVALNMLASVYGRPVEWFYGVGPPDEATDDDIDIEDPELRLFFRGEWDELTDSEKEFIKGMIRESRDLLRKRRETGGQ